MKKRYSKFKNKKNKYTSEAPHFINENEKVNIKTNKKQCNNEHFEQTNVSSMPNDLKEIHFRDIKWVAYRNLFPNTTKVKTGTQILAALKNYDFSQAKEKETPDGEEDDYFSEHEMEIQEMPKVLSKKLLSKQLRGGKLLKPKVSSPKKKGFCMPRDPVYNYNPC